MLPDKHLFFGIFSRMYLGTSIEKDEKSKELIIERVLIYVLRHNLSKDSHAGTDTMCLDHGHFFLRTTPSHIAKIKNPARTLCIEYDIFWMDIIVYQDGLILRHIAYTFFHTIDGQEHTFASVFMVKKITFLNFLYKPPYMFWKIRRFSVVIWTNFSPASGSYVTYLVERMQLCDTRIQLFRIDLRISPKRTGYILLNTPEIFTGHPRDLSFSGREYPRSILSLFLL